MKTPHGKEFEQNMKTLIVYTSQTGFTKKYAQWMAESLGADVLELKEAQKKDVAFFDAYEAIVYAAWVMASTVVKVKWFLGKAENWKGKKLAIVSVGGSPVDNPDVDVMLDKLLTDEQKQYIRAFYCQGGFDYDKMNAPSRFAMKMFRTSLKNSKDEKNRQVAAMIDHSYDISDRKYIAPVVGYINGRE